MKFKAICLIMVLTMVSGVCATNSGYSQIQDKSAGDNDVIYVDNSIGNDNNSGLTPEEPKKTIKNATATVSEKGTVIIADGIYTGEGNRNITLDKDIEIVGENEGETIINAHKQDMVFIIQNDKDVLIDTLTIKNGGIEENNSAIYNKGYLIVTECIFEGDDDEVCNAIYNEGSCSAGTCTFLDNLNIANDESGSLRIFRCDITGMVFNAAECEVERTNFSGNSGGIDSYEGTLNVDASTFSDGCGICNSKGSCNVTGSIFNCKNCSNPNGYINNIAGDLTVKRSKFFNNKASYGSAIRNFDSACTVVDCDFIGNTAIDSNCEKGGFGGAIYHEGDNDKNVMDISGCNFINNAAKSVAGSDEPSAGGAIYNEKGKCIATGCNFVGNTADNGGAINNGKEYFATCILHFNRFVGNRASKGSAIFSNEGSVDAVYNWWGSNNGPQGLNVGNVNDNAWLKLSIKVNPSQIKKGGTSKIVVDLYADSNGRNHNSEYAKYPPAIPFIFKSTWGSVTQNVMRYGATYATFTAKGAKPPKYVMVSVADSARPADSVAAKINIVK